MSFDQEYANARFKSDFVKKYKTPKTAKEYAPPSDPFYEKGARTVIPEKALNQKHLRDRSMVRSELFVAPKVFDKISNSVGFDTLARPSLTEAREATEIRARVARQPEFRQKAGTVSTSRKPIPVVEKVGQIQQHPTSKVDEALMKQEALRNVAGLPKLLEKLQRRLTMLPQEPQASAVGAGKPLPPPPPQPPQKPPPKAELKDPVRVVPSSLTSSSSSSDDGGEEKEIAAKIQRARAYVDYLKSILGALSPTDETQVDRAITEDLTQKGFAVQNTRGTKTQKGLHKYVTGQIGKLEKFLKEEGTKK
jgi:hypothetical protein